jgi:hypothetical protein
MDEEEPGYWEILAPHPTKDELVFDYREEMGLLHWEFAW